MLGVVPGVIEGRLGDTDRLRRDPKATALEGLEGVPESLARLPDQVLRSQIQILQGGGHRLRPSQAHLPFLLSRNVSVSDRRHEECADPLRAPAVLRVVRPDHHQDHIGRGAVRDPHLGAVQSPTITIANGLRRDRSRIASGISLGQREGAEDLATGHWLQPAFLLFGRAIPK